MLSDWKSCSPWRREAHKSIYGFSVLCNALTEQDSQEDEEAV